MVANGASSCASTGLSAAVEAAQTRSCNGENAVTLGQLLASGDVNEVTTWLEAELRQPQRLVSPLNDVTAKLKCLETLRLAAEQLETRLHRQQRGLELQLTPGLSDRYLERRQHYEVRNKARSFPLSYAQQQMLALQHMNPESAAYNVTKAVRVTSKLPLDAQALEAAVQSLLTKHEALRSLFDLDAVSGDPQQTILPVSSDSIGLVNLQAHSQSVSRVLNWTGTTAEYADDSVVGEFIASRVVSEPFDLSRELPVRVIAVQEPPSSEAKPLRWTLAVVLHHIVTDGASSSIIWTDLFQSYTSLLSPDAVEIQTSPEQVVHYRDYAVWQRERVKSGALDASITYWIQQFNSSKTQRLTSLPVLDLPFDKRLVHIRETPASSVKGDVIRFNASITSLERLTALCQPRGCSLFMGLLAVFFELLSRLAGGATDVTVGTPVSTRDREELQQVVGYFVNTLPLRIQSPLPSNGGQTTFTDLLMTVRDVVLGAFEHMELPFHEIQDNIRASTRQQRHTGSEYGVEDSRRQPLYQVMFALEHHTVDTTNTSRFGPEVRLPHTTAKFDLMLTMRVVADQGASSTLEGEMEYPLDRFTRETVENFTRYYCELLEQVSLLPDKPLGSIPMLPQVDQQLMVETWGSPRPPSSPVNQSVAASASPYIDECLRRQVGLTPSSWALHFDDGVSWTYETLWCQSSRVLLALNSQTKCQSQLRVGLFLARGMEQAAAIVGALRARAVFVPLDASFPSERLRYMIQDAALHAIVTQRSHEEKLAKLLAQESEEGSSRLDQGGGRAVNVQVFTWEDLPSAGEDDDDLLDTQPNLEGDAAAYILYTSGSTGSPKGVVISHRNLLTTLRWTTQAYSVSSSDVFLQSTSATLDGSLTQLLSPLLAGASAVITRDGGLHDLDYMRSLLSAPPPRAVTYCVLVPSYLSTLLDYQDDKDDAKTFCFPPTLKHVVVVGEAFPMELARNFYRLLVHNHGVTSCTCLVNEYGPTEAAVTSTFYPLPLDQVLTTGGDDGGSSELDTVPIGVPIDGRRVVVLDSSGRLVPPNIRGELFLGGPGVSIDGYWRRPELTRAAFEHPELSDMLNSRCGGVEDTRWYRTGDVVKWLPDGNLEFVGRVDAQVKLHGQRVELNEVRNVLLRHEHVIDAEVRVITPSNGQRSGPRLVAFVVLAAGRHTQRQSEGGDGVGDGLVAFLRERLPLHMIPNNIRAVSQWPRTPNGKLDVRKLLNDESAAHTVKLEPSVTSSESSTSSVTSSPRTGSDQRPTESSLTHRVTRDLLLQIWRQVLDLDVNNISQEDRVSRSFFSLGGDSLAAIRAMSLARARGFSLTLDAFFTCSNVDEMASRVTSSSLTSQPLVPLNVASKRPSLKDNAPPTLFLVHCADGTVWKLLELASLLPFRVVGVQATASHAAETVEALAEKYWTEIQRMQASGPYALGGFSFGCRVAYAMARVASREGHQLHPLTLLDGVPFYEEDEGSSSSVDVEEYITETFGGQRPQGDEAELFDTLAAQFRAHCVMEDAYRPVTRSSRGDKSSGSPSTGRELKAVVFKTDKWELDAAAIRRGGVDVDTVTFPGVTHLTLLHHPHVAQVAASIIKRLDG